MRQILIFIVAIAAIANGLVYCVRPPEYPDEPVIAFMNVTPDTILQKPFFTKPDSVFTDLKFSFTDGDGDLGFEDKDTTFSIIIYDLRSPDLPNRFRFPLIDPQGAGNGVSGEVTLRVPVSCCIPDPLNGISLPPCDTSSVSNQTIDTLIYSIRIKDRAGNWSNEITSTPIILRCRR